MIAGKWLQLISWTTIGFILFVSIRYLFEEVIYLHLLGHGNYYLSIGEYIWNNLWWYALPLIMTSVIIYSVERNIQSQKEQMILQQEKTVAELSFLRSQINPHFLFNTLSFLHTEAFQRDPELADMILKVSDILRYSVESTKAGKRAIRQEVKLIYDYIDIFKKRFEGRCFINFNVSGDDQSQLIEPLLLIPFVENAFKHGSFSDADHPININLSISKNELRFHLQNQIKKQIKDTGSGIGVKNVKRRLEVLYPGKHELNITANSNDYEVILSLRL
jgi:LytS/YehU family sensor histidine kinase